MAKIIADIKARGINQGHLVDIFYEIVTSIQGICAKLDAGGGVTDTDFEQLCVTDLFSVVIDDTRGSHLNLGNTESSSLVETFLVSPKGMGRAEINELMYQVTNSWETMCEKLDADAGVTDTNYEALWFTATFLHLVKSQRSDTALGNGVVVTFAKGAVPNLELVDWLFNVLTSITGLAIKLDADVTDSDHNSLWFTDNITLTVENSAGSRVGN